MLQRNVKMFLNSSVNHDKKKKDEYIQCKFDNCDFKSLLCHSGTVADFLLEDEQTQIKKTANEVDKVILCVQEANFHSHFCTAFSCVDSKHISAAVAGKLNHIRSLMSVYGSICAEKNS